ncbi:MULTISPECIES: uroporphyrinogen-III synthase [Bacillaceae]|uniref:Uroporphyrinogen-III synthase n=1 Tax=Evansella alkalicola TaxID=745819 RepID=A0ABS6JU52_9BACI|nr:MULTISPECIES: uroporphyrinogen-III synthase [Bacillaceae]MBU9721945.1 uroporphyrinogen-III synthase [Bacillus alkalicola]
MTLLHGKSILNTRAVHQAAELTKKLEEYGGEVIEFPLISISEPKDPRAVKEAIQKMENYQWLVFTSANSVDFFIHYLKQAGKETTLLKEYKVAAVGNKTVMALEDFEVEVDLVPKQFDGVHLTEELVKVVSGPVLFPRSNLSSNHLINVLQNHNIKVDAPFVYETTYNFSNKIALNEALKLKHIDIITFTSPSTVHSFFQQVNHSDKSLHDLSYAVIGTVTAKALKGYGISEMIIPDSFTIESMVEAMIDKENLMRGKA